jgi:hypothetical protein
MQVTLSEPSRVSDLAQFLADHAAYVSHAHVGVLEVGFIGSLNVESQWVEAERQVQAWVEANPDVVAAISS